MRHDVADIAQSSEALAVDAKRNISVVSEHRSIRRRNRGRDALRRNDDLACVCICSKADVSKRGTVKHSRTDLGNGKFKRIAVCFRDVVGGEILDEAVFTERHRIVFRRIADRNRNAEELVCRLETGRFGDRRPAACILCGSGRIAKLAAEDLHAVAVRTIPSVVISVLHFGRAVKVAEIERFADHIIDLCTASKPVETDSFKLLLLGDRDGVERHLDILAVKDGIEGQILVSCRHLDAGNKGRPRRQVLIDDLNDIVRTERIGETHVLRLGIIARRCGRTGRIDRPVAPRVDVRRHIAVIIVPRESIGVGSACVRTVVVIFRCTADKSRKQTGRFADTVHEHPAVISDNDAHAARVRRAGIERRCRSIILAQRDPEVGIVPHFIVVLRRDGLDRPFQNNGRTLTDGSGRHRVDGLARSNRTERLDLRKIALRRIVGGCGMESFDRDPLILAVFELDGRLRRTAGTARFPVCIRLAELVIDTHFELIARRDLGIVDDVPLRLGRHGSVIDADRSPCDGRRVKIARFSRDDDRRSIISIIHAHLDRFDGVVECRHAGSFVCRLRIRERNARLRTVNLRGIDLCGRFLFILRTAREQAQRQYHRK